MQSAITHLHPVPSDLGNPQIIYRNLLNGLEPSGGEETAARFRNSGDRRVPTRHQATGINQRIITLMRDLGTGSATSRGPLRPTNGWLISPGCS